MTDSAKPPAPRHLWAVGIASLLWNLFQCYDYVMAQRRDPEYLAQTPRDMAAYLDSFPLWSTALWAVGVWGALAGSALLLARSRHASSLFLLASASTAITYTYHYAIGMPASINTLEINLFKAGILASFVALWWYARRMGARGVLE